MAEVSEEFLAKARELLVGQDVHSVEPVEDGGLKLWLSGTWVVVRAVEFVGAPVLQLSFPTEQIEIALSTSRSFAGVRRVPRPEGPH